MDNVEALSSAEIEKALSSEFKKKQPIASLELPFSVRSISIPKTDIGHAAYTLSMTDTEDSDKTIIYKAMIAAYNHAFFDKSAALSAKGNFSSSVKPFIAWLNTHNIENRYEILKLYETDRMDELDNHGGLSPLASLKTVLGYAIESESLRKELSSDEYAYLIELRKTKHTPNLNRSQKSIASYFGALDWLRRDDIGIGSDMYSALASPKLAVNSLSLTAATVILELKTYKDELQTLIRSIKPQLSPWLVIESKDKTHVKRKAVGNIIYLMLSIYHKQDNPSNALKAALRTFILFNSSSLAAYSTISSALKSQEECDSLFLNKVRDKAKVNANFTNFHFSSLLDDSLFSIEWIKRVLKDDSSKALTNVEGLMFAWLMASLTVQPYDIPKLRHSDFRLMKVGGRVVDIECEYFKGRAKVFHTTRSLSTRTPEGKALLTLLEQQDEGLPFFTKQVLVISNKINSLLGVFNALLQISDLSEKLEATHEKQQLPNLMPQAICALISHGIHSENVIENPVKITIEERRKLVAQSQSTCQRYIFGLQAIKNSAVHAFSDPYTLHYLINRNSHSNQTEKASYLTEENEEWMNSSGRITREVMLDLIQNVFNLNFDQDNEKQVAAFNSEFMAVTDLIAYKHEEMNARLRVVTGQEKGRVNEVGVMALSDQKENEALSPIYVSDSPITVLKMYNYLHEFKKNYKKLLSHNPEHLFKTVIPTVEWLEDTLPKMSKASQRKGREQFDLMIKNGVVMSVFHSM
ncbi:TPA: hypothetical protein JG821_002596 [Vibrio parahaemolyticus]|uniref:hypothetical protein n=1 Tax=Vibrio parahaemolyticus TaxID=670 RepID=UPI000426CAF1|nr:hypothetical protein [Vibrio parahaemolyticus]ELA9840023.1 hypothetical protein [Vibrio parahaemolyticus]MBE4292702.1 hypothetical protein [Vibrio parahaemolyticus]TOJ17940.1 hypothetical protein CGI45_08700 [Vibrio parahaemolyticus]HAV1514374.1 hypothetical protein [Vibrio parahaemolyticus]HCG8411312.1 hypothetical protein [Vibrio parahaemolyticus]